MTITGSVLPSGESVVVILVRGTNGQIARVQSTIDTGFNDFLTLSPSVIERLQLASEGEAVYFLADGEQSTSRRYLAEVEWLGTWRTVYVTELDRDALIGTRLMEGCLLSIEMIDGGKVELRPLQSS